MSCHWPEAATVSRVVQTRFLNSGGQFDLPCNLFGGAILVRVVELSSPMAIGVPRSKVCHARSGDFSDQEWLLLIFRCVICQYGSMTASQPMLDISSCVSAPLTMCCIFLSTGSVRCPGIS